MSNELEYVIKWTCPICGGIGTAMFDNIPGVICKECSGIGYLSEYGIAVQPKPFTFYSSIITFD